MAIHQFAVLLGLLSAVCLAHGDHGHGDHHDHHVDPETKGVLAKPHEHQCIHDTKEMQNLFYHHGHDMIAPQPGDKNFHELAIGNLRIVTSTVDLDTAGRFCSVTGGTSPDYKGGTVTCTADDILTTEKKTLLLNTILPAALQKLSDRLKVNQATANVVVPAGSCQYFTQPAAHSSTGVASADYVLYVAAGPTTGSTVAWAGYCRTDAAGRPIIGRVNFGPKYLTWSTTDPSANDLTVGTAVHELMHALGFSDYFMTNGFIGGDKRITETRRGKTVKALASTNALANARSYYACATLTGVETEDEGDSGSALSHWDRRNAQDDVMAPVVGPSKISATTLGYFQDTGHYTVDYTKAEAARWGKDGGCSFFSEKCNTAGGGLGKFFCNVKNEQACTEDLKSIGSCVVSTYSGALPAQFQYFAGAPNDGGYQFMDYCPYVQGYSNRKCNVDVVETQNDIIFGQYYGPGGRCVAVNALIQSGYSGSNGNQRCLQLRCPGGTRVQFKVGSSAWTDCPADGSSATVNAPSGYTGTITCPPASKVCDSDLLYGTAATTTAPPTTTGAPTTTVAGQTPAPTTTTTTKAPTTAAPTTTASASSCDTSYLLSTSAASPSKVLSVGSINGILREHNNARRLVSPGAATMPMLRWNQKLADYAQQYISQCAGLVHSTTADRQNMTRFGFSYVGENLAAGTSTIYGAANGGAESTKLWVGEKVDWQWGQVCASGKVCGHYTQVIWAATTDVGCGYAYCPQQTYKNFWSCVYGSGGNYVGQKEYTQGSNVCQLSSAAGTAAPYPSVVPGSTTPAPAPPTSGVTGELSITAAEDSGVERVFEEETKAEMERRLNTDLTRKLEKTTEVTEIRYMGNNQINVKFEVQDATTAELKEKSASLRTDVSWMSETSALFVEVTGQGPQAVSNVEMDDSTSGQTGASDVCGTACYGFVGAGIGAVALVVIGVVVAIVKFVRRPANAVAAKADARAPTSV